MDYSQFKRVGAPQEDPYAAFKRAGAPAGGLSVDAPASGLSADAQGFRTPALGAENAPPGLVEQFLGGAKHWLDRAAYGAKDLFTDLRPEEQQLLQQGKAFIKETGPASSVGEIAAEVPLYAATGGVAALPRVAAALPRVLSGALTRQVAAAGLTGAAITPGDAGERFKAGALDAAGAAAGGALAKTLSRAALPIGQKPAAVQLLEDKGVRPTFGQAMSTKPGALARAVGRMEESSMSVPFGGAVVRNRRAQALEGFQNAARRNALPPGADPAAARSTEELRAAFKRAYDGELLQVPLPKPVLKWSPKQVVQRVAQGLPVTQAQRLDAQAFVRDVQRKHIAAGGKNATAAAAHAIQSDLRTAAGKFMRSQEPDKQAYGELLANVAEDFGRTWREALPTQIAERIAAIDRQYAAYVPVRHAAKSNPVSRAPDDFTPAVLLRALRTTERTPNKNQFIAGTRPGQELARAAEDVLTSRVPDSGTPERAFNMGAGLGLLVQGLNAALLVPPAAVGLYGTQPVQNYLMGRYAGQEALAAALRRAMPLSAATAAAATGD